MIMLLSMLVNMNTLFNIKKNGNVSTKKLKNYDKLKI